MTVKSRSTILSSLTLSELGPKTVCKDCSEQLKSILTLDSPWGSVFPVSTFENGQWVPHSVYTTGQKIPDIPGARFGIYKWGDWSYGDTWCGKTGLKIADITPEYLAAKHKGPRMCIGWRNHVVNSDLRWRSETDHVFFDVDTRSVDRRYSLERVRTYARLNKLEDCDILTTTDEPRMRIFCTPESAEIMWFDSLKEMKAGRRNGKIIPQS